MLSPTQGRHRPLSTRACSPAWCACVPGVRTCVQREGIGGFYKGLVPNVLRVMPQSALTFLVYESVMRLLSKQRQAAEAAVAAVQQPEREPR